MTCTILFLLCTVHVGVSLQQLLDAFIYAPADVPDYFTTYWLDDNSTASFKYYLFITMVGRACMLVYRIYAQRINKVTYPEFDSSKFKMATMICVLRHALVVNEIWRLYVVFMYDWRVVIFPVSNRSSRSSVIYTESASQVMLMGGSMGS